MADFIETAYQEAQMILLSSRLGTFSLASMVAATLSWSASTIAKAQSPELRSSYDRMVVGKYQTKEGGDSYEIKSWAVQWELAYGKRPDRVWIVFSSDPSTPMGM